MKIEEKEIDMSVDYLSPVTYIPSHADGCAGHPDCQKGVILRLSKDAVRVLYSNSRTVQSTRPEDLVWG
jgi:hypothetical protein